MAIYDPSDSTYNEPPQLQAVTAGQGYWLITRGAQTISMSGTSTRLDQDFTIDLQEGFNQICNPFAFSVAWDSVMTGTEVNDYLYGWNGEDYDAFSHQTMEIGRGYWVYCDATDSLRIPPNPSGTMKAPAVAVTSKQSSSRWRKRPRNWC